MKQESVMNDERRQAAKKRMVTLMQEGRSWREAATLTGIQTSRSTAYRWFQQFRIQGEVDLYDGRHGHIAKMHQPIREWLAARCREEPGLPSSSLQNELNAHFGVLVSITHLNRIRVVHGLERQPAQMKKNLDHSSTLERDWQDGAGGLLLVAAVHETGLLAHLETAMASLFDPDFPSPPLPFFALSAQLVAHLTLSQCRWLAPNERPARLHRRGTGLVDRKAQSLQLLAH